MSEEEKGIKEEERKKDFDDFLEQIKKTRSTKEERKRVADSYKRYLKSIPKSDRDTCLVFLAEGKITSVKREDIPEKMVENPEFYERYRNLFKEKGTKD